MNKNSHSKTNKCTNVKIIFFLHKICHNSDMFRCILIIFRKLRNISKAYIMFSSSLKIIKIARKMSELWQIVRKKYNFNVSAFVGFIVWNMAMFEWWKRVHALVADSWNINILSVLFRLFCMRNTSDDFCETHAHTHTHRTRIPRSLLKPFCMPDTCDEFCATHIVRTSHEFRAPHFVCTTHVMKLRNTHFVRTTHELC